MNNQLRVVEVVNKVKLLYVLEPSSTKRLFTFFSQKENLSDGFIDISSNNIIMD